MKVVFCLPGRSFSGEFLSCWTDLYYRCLANGITPILSQRYSCNIYYVRTNCLGADVTRGKNQKPFNGKLDYDYIMWIDSDIIFNSDQFMKLLSHQKDICSGLYLMQGGKNYATVETWDEDFFAKHGYFKFMSPEDIKNKTELIKVNYTGMGWMLVKKGVYESIEYPWFEPIRKEINGYTDFTMEDVAFCHKAIENNYDIHIDPTVIVGHEKTVVL
jgi:hypothetical protein